MVDYGELLSSYGAELMISRDSSVQGAVDIVDNA